MKQIKLLGTLFLTCLFFSSCYRIILGSVGVLDSSASFKKASSADKEIVFIPMHHVGKQSFYEDVKNSIDSLRKEGFVFYYEGVKYSKIRDSLRNDTLAMKLRHVIGLDMRTLSLQGGYIDTLDGTIAGLKNGIAERYKLVNQPKYSLYDTTVDRRVDAYLSDLMATFEEKYGKLLLTACDFNTKPTDKYKCKKTSSKEEKMFLMLLYRNDLITKEILKDSHSKIVLVYGAKHFDGILKNLQQHDSTWKRN